MSYVPLYLRPARLLLLMLQLAASRALSELSAEHAHRPYIVAAVVR